MTLKRGFISVILGRLSDHPMFTVPFRSACPNGQYWLLVLLILPFGEELLLLCHADDWKNGARFAKLPKYMEEKLNWRQN